jgi:hypothetical protein
VSKWTRVDKTTAIVLDYNGMEITRVEAFDSSNPVFTCTGKRFDVECCQQEMRDENQAVYLPAILRSIEKIDSLLALTKKDGVWQKPLQKPLQK